MRCMIFGLDGLEYTLVKEFHLQNIMQKEYGTVDVSHFSLYAYKTPVIWASFITGLLPEQHGVTSIKKFDSKPLDFIKNLLVRLGFFNVKQIACIPESLPFTRKYYQAKDFKRRNIETIFDITKNSVAISVPSYNEYAINEKLRRAIYDVVAGNLKEDKFDKMILKAFYQEKERVLELLKSDWDLFMVHFLLMDLVGHLYRGEPSKLFRYYLLVDSTIHEIKKELGESTFTLIISDHGMKALGRFGDHGNPAFYSTNISLNLTNPKITDFKGIIKETINRK